MHDEIISIPLDDPRYPEQLRQITNPPETLYARGNLSLLTHPLPLAVVGSRKCTRYGEQVAHALLPTIARAGICLVSGLALGLDRLAHEAALAVNGETIAVLPSSITDEAIYPREHLELARRILAHGGLLLSETASGESPRVFSFPVRNRIISGLSNGLLIIEAARKSGSLTTAFHALDQNRTVYAVPGNIFSPMSEGTNALITQGATPVCNAETLLRDLGVVSQQTTPLATTHTDPLFERIICQLSTGAQSAENIARETRTELSQTLAALTELELAGVVSETSDALFMRCDTVAVRKE